MENDQLQINYEIDKHQFRRIWLEMFIKALPKFLSFWGIAVLFCLVLWWFTEFSSFFGWFTLFCAAVPFSTVYLTYQNYVRTAENAYALLSEEERHIQLTFTRNSEGFEFRNGKNYGFIAWESIKSIEETAQFLTFNRSSNGFYIPKSVFRDESELKFIKFLAAANGGQNVKFLD